MVPCSHRNGEITAYSVRYGVQGQSTQTVIVSGADTTETSIRIITSTTYSIEVAAVNFVDTGPYSDPITVETPQSKCSVCRIRYELGFMVYMFRCISQSEW